MNKRSSVVRRLAIYIVLIESFVLIVVGLLIYRYAWLQDQTESRAREATVEQGADQINDLIDAVSQMMQNLYVDSRISQLAYHSYLNEYDRSRIVLGLISNLNNMKDLNPVIENVKISFPGDELELSSEGGYNRWREYQPPSDQEIKLTEFLYYDGEKGTLKLRMAYPLITTVTGKAPDYACEVTLSRKFLEVYLQTFGSSLQNGAVVVLSAQDGSLQLAGDNVGLLPEEDIKAFRKDLRFDGTALQLQYSRMEHYPITLAAWRQTGTLTHNMIMTLISIALVIMFTVLLLMLMLRHANRSIGRPLRKLMMAFEAVKGGDLSTHISHNRTDEFSYIYESFNEMTDQNRQLIEDIKEQHSLLQNAELAQLQAQIDPHFLYNSFNIIKYMADGEEYEQITEFVSSLAEYYRFINKETRQAIPLSAEVRHMETYVYIQQMRFESRIQVDEGKLPEEAAAYPVPKLILQPLIENCYKHGLKNKLADGVITITYHLEYNRLTITIEDNGGEMTEEKLEEIKAHLRDATPESISHALANTRRRLELAYGDPEMLNVGINQERGLIVRLWFDLTKKVT